MCVRAQVASAGAIRVHRREHVPGEALEQPARQAIDLAARLQPQKPREQPLREEAGLRLARMLSVDDPRRQRAGAHADHVEFAPVQRLADRGYLQPGCARCRGSAARDEVELPLIRVEIEVREEG